MPAPTVRKTRLLFLLLSALVTLPRCATTGSKGQSDVVGGGIPEPDYKYPWVVQTAGTNGCHGVLIHPKWVLTAAHCVDTGATSVSFRRTDPYTGAVDEEERVPVGPGLSGVFVHPMFNVPSAQANDIALIKLAQPFSVNPYIQTVGLPPGPRAAGVVGTVASSSHTMMLPPDKVAIFRAPIPQDAFVQGFHVFTTDATGSLCPGDSGSGFVTYENGRATVRGIASTVNMTSDCVTPAGNEVDFVDVFAYRDWILKTIGMTDYFLAGNTRARWSGRASRGVIGIGCVNPYGTMWGPLNVFGVEEGANCESDQTQTVVCSLSAGQTGPPAMAMRITSFTMKTTSEIGAVDVQSLPFSSSWASYSGLLPHGAYREFTCRVWLADVYDPGDGGVFKQ